MCAGTVEERSIVEPVRAVMGSKVRWRLHYWWLARPAEVQAGQPAALEAGASPHSRPKPTPPQGKFFEAKCTDVMPEEKTIVACFPGE